MTWMLVITFLGQPLYAVAMPSKEVCLAYRAESPETKLVGTALFCLPKGSAPKEGPGREV